MQQKPCHDYHWVECDRVDADGPCEADGRQHVRVDGWEHPMWLCDKHAQAVQAER